MIILKIGGFLLICGMYLCIVSVYCIMNCFFNAFIRLSVIFCIYEHVLKISYNFRKMSRTLKTRGTAERKRRRENESKLRNTKYIKYTKYIEIYRRYTI